MSILNIFMPQICYLCDKSVQYSGLCHSCWNSIQFVENPACISCGDPFEYDLGNIKCMRCIENNKHIDYGKTIMKYDRNIKKLIVGYKNHQCFYLEKFFTQFLYNATKEWHNKIDYIIPIPIHHWRFFWRGYNQTAILAKNLSNLTNIPYITDGLLKTKFTLSQSKFNKQERWKNVQKTFQFNNVYTEKLYKKNILLLDDVTTTGATLNFAAKELKESNVKTIYSITIAKTIFKK